jgi:hypothetical protein
MLKALDRSIGRLIIGHMALQSLKADRKPPVKPRKEFSTQSDLRSTVGTEMAATAVPEAKFSHDTKQRPSLQSQPHHVTGGEDGDRRLTGSRSDQKYRNDKKLWSCEEPEASRVYTSQPTEEVTS